MKNNLIVFYYYFFALCTIIFQKIILFFRKKTEGRQQPSRCSLLPFLKNSLDLSGNFFFHLQDVKRQLLYPLIVHPADRG